MKGQEYACKCKHYIVYYLISVKMEKEKNFLSALDNLFSTTVFKREWEAVRFFKINYRDDEGMLGFLKP